MNYNERGELVSAESYKNDKLNGKKITYYLNDQLENGKLTVLSVTIFRDDIRDGAYKEYYPNNGAARGYGYTFCAEKNNNNILFI
jgi:antitoxin component YwqK of YwqJK toxin-antitoxin module